MNTPEEKLIKVEGILKQLEDKFKKLGEEFDAKKAEIDAITNIKNARLKVTNGRGESIKEKKAFGQKIAGFFGKNTANTARRLTDAKARLQHMEYGYYMMRIDEIKRQYQQYENIKKNLELEIQRGKEMQERQEKSNKNAEEKNKIEKQKLDLIPRYTKLGYTYVPEKTTYENSCAGLSSQSIEYMGGGCKSVAVKIPYTDSFQYITETKKQPTDGKWSEEKQTITIPAKYEKRIIPATTYTIQGYGSSDTTFETVKVADEREEVVSVWKRDLPAGFPEIVNYADFPTKIIELESKSNSKNVQSRKRKQNRRKSMKARKN